MDSDDLALEGTLDASSTRIGGRYVLLGLLGVGGMGSVYRVRDTTLDEIVALKMLREADRDAGALARFRDEVRLARRVTHRNVARTYDIGQHGATHFLTMELIVGESLAARLAREGPRSVREALAITRQLAAGLAAAHEADVVHRDLKTENVVIEASGRAVITDFGIAYAPRAAARPASFAGTPATMAPEQVRGLPDIDARADVYALGAVLYELLTGAPAWTGPNPIAAAFARLEQPPPDPRQRVSSLPVEVAAFVVGLLAIERDARPADGAAVLQALDALEAARAAAAPRPSMDTPRPGAPLAPVPRDRLTLAVLPLRTDAQDAALAGELREDLVDRLARAGGLRVRPVSPQRAQALGGLEADPFELGRQLDVAVLVAPTLKRMPAGVRLAARAFDVREELQVWSDGHEGDERELFAFNDRLACALGEALSTTVRSEGRRALGDPRALERYVAARHALRLAWSGTVPLGPVVAQFDEALALAPDDPLVLSGAAMARARARNFDPGASGPDVARILAERALALAPDAAEPRLALATISYAESDWPAAARGLRATLLRAPALAQAHLMLGSLLSEVGEPGEARARLTSALALDPSLGQARLELVRLDALEGRWERVEAAVAELDTLVARGDETGRALAASRFDLWRGGRHLSRADAPGQDAFPPLFAAYEEALSGRPVRLEPLRVVVAGVRRGSRFRHAVAQVYIELCAFSGRTDEAFELLADIADDHLYDLPWLDRCPVLAALRARPEAELLRARVEARCRVVQGALTAPLS